MYDYHSLSRWAGVLLVAAGGLLMPTSGAQAADSGIISIPLDFPKKYSRQCPPPLRICGDVLVKQAGDYHTPAPPDYKFCAYQIITTSANPGGAHFWVDNRVSATGEATFGYDVPCGGGGVSLGTLNDLTAVAISAAIVYFTGGFGSGTAILKANTWSALNTAIGNYALVSAAGSVTQQQVFPGNYSAGLCGVGDAGNWLNGAIKLHHTKSYLSCPATVEAGWQNFANPLPNTLNPALPAILDLLLDDSPATPTTPVTAALPSKVQAIFDCAHEVYPTLFAEVKERTEGEVFIRDYPSGWSLKIHGNGVNFWYKSPEMADYDGQYSLDLINSIHCVPHGKGY